MKLELRERPSLVVVLVCLTACPRPPTSPSEVAQQVAQRLCSIQSDCDCAEELLIDDCTHVVTSEVTDNEQRALHAGLTFDPTCFEMVLANLDALATCEPEPTLSPIDCTAYYGAAQVGDPCTIYELFPPMSDCQQGLECRVGACRDLDNPPVLQQGELCSDSQSVVPTGFLGECAPGLTCDSNDTRLCVPADPNLPVPLGGECTAIPDCEQGLFCRPADGATEVSEQEPGTCSNFTPAGAPCTLLYECERFCVDGFCERPPPLLCSVLDDWAGSRVVIEQQPAP